MKTTYIKIVCVAKAVRGGSAILLKLDDRCRKKIAGSLNEGSRVVVKIYLENGLELEADGTVKNVHGKPYIYLGPSYEPLKRYGWNIVEIMPEDRDK